MTTENRPETIRVVAAVLERGGKFLICLRPSVKRHGGKWEFPGGKVEENEAAEDALAREIKEELGLRLVSIEPSLCSVCDPGSAFCIEFFPVHALGEPVPFEHAELRWASVEELKSLPLAPADRRFADEVLTCRR